MITNAIVVARDTLKPETLQTHNGLLNAMFALAIL